MVIHFPLITGRAFQMSCKRERGNRLNNKEFLSGKRGNAGMERRKSLHLTSAISETLSHASLFSSACKGTSVGCSSCASSVFGIFQTYFLGLELFEMNYYSYVNGYRNLNKSCKF